MFMLHCTNALLTPLASQTNYPHKMIREINLQGWEEVQRMHRCQLSCRASLRHKVFELAMKTEQHSAVAHPFFLGLKPALMRNIQQPQICPPEDITK